MTIRTIEGNFEYRMKEVLSPLHEQWQDAAKNKETEKDFPEWLWESQNAADLGRALIDDIETYCGFEDIDLGE